MINIQFTVTVPVAFMFFNRYDTTIKVFDSIKKVKPQKLYLISDGARANKEGEKELVNKIRKYIEENIDWECQIHKNYAKENLGCGKRVYTGISWVLDQEEEVIILEDDILANISFFKFCEEMLIKYKNDTRITAIAGHNMYQDIVSEKESYIFSKHPNIWGWATWRRAWKLYEESMAGWIEIRKSNAFENYYGKEIAKRYKPVIEKAYSGEIDTWDYQWNATVVYHDGMGIIPKYNLIENIGFNSNEATHTKGDSKYSFEKHELVFPLIHPTEVKRNEQYDKIHRKNMLKEFRNWTAFGRILNKLGV